MSYYKFSLKLFQNKKIDVYNNFKHSRDFTFIDDVVSLIFRCKNKVDSNKKNISKIYNVGSGKKTSLKNLVNLLEKNFKKNFNLKLHKKQLGDIENTLANISLAKKELGYNPKISFSKGIKKFSDWFKRYYKNENRFIKFRCW